MNCMGGDGALDHAVSCGSGATTCKGLGGSDLLGKAGKFSQLFGKPCLFSGKLSAQHAGDFIEERGGHRKLEVVRAGSSEKL